MLTYTLLTLAAKVMLPIYFFAPSLGLFGILVHWKNANKEYSNVVINDTAHWEILQLRSNHTDFLEIQKFSYYVLPFAKPGVVCLLTMFVILLFASGELSQ